MWDAELKGTASLSRRVLGLHVGGAYRMLGASLIISADVLSTVQSSIAGGQDASQTLSRLMDWAEAREVS